ncbi:DDE-type integrase/transposase/recombinase [Bacillus sp. SYJ]|uniref:integrase catalytic domain-containing protein n=1 Tax=Bacillus sp. SYJ TaxID=2529386 RepID=UPI0013F1C2DD|nr:DDE-type integrase/transposase/recombinase [Bacillus sp. SYJ]
MAVNTVIQWKEGSERDEFERILWLSRDDNLAVIFPLTPSVSAKTFPQYCVLSEIEGAIKDGIAVQRTIDPYARLADSDLLKRFGDKKDEAWSRIKDIALDEPDIYNPKLRGKMIQELVDKKVTTKRTIYKSLRKYWRYGKTPDALLPLYKECGGPGKKREITEKMIKEAEEKGKTIPKRGRPVIGSKEYPVLIGINVTEIDKQNMANAIREYYQQTKKPNMVDTHEHLLNNYYTVVDKQGNKIVDPLRRYPSLGQLKSFFYSNQNLRETLIKREGETAYNQRYRPVMGFSTQNEQIGPGSVYQMDATTLGVHIVNRFDRTRKISKPIVYLVMDVMSRMIVGCYVGLGTAWEDAKISLLDAFLNCGQFSSDVKNELNKICYLPQVIVTDNGPELKGFNSDSLAEFFGVRITNTPPYRPDWKAIVEQQFNQLRRQLCNLPGFVKKGYRERGEKDHREEATLDIEEITKIVRLIIQKHNYHNYMSNYPQEEAMMMEGVQPFPVKLWEWGIENKRGAFNQISTDKAIVGLLPKKTATITEFGVNFQDKYYTCSRAVEEQWFIREGPHINKKLKIAYDYRDSGVIYLILNEGQSIELCTLQSRSRQFDNYRVEEVNDWFIKGKVRNNLNKHEKNQVEINFNLQVEEIVEESQKKTSEAQKSNPKSKTAQLVEIRRNKGEAKENIRELTSQKLHQELDNLVQSKKEIKEVVEEIPSEKLDVQQKEFNPIQSKEVSIRNKLKEWKKQKGS